MRPWGPARHFLIPTLVLGIVAGCGGGGAGVTGGTGTRKTNTPPTVTGLTVSPGDATLVRYKQYNFTAKTSDPDIGDTVTRFDWDFGGGNTFTTAGPTINFSFLSSGVQTVKVRAYDGSNTPGEWASFQGTVDNSVSPIAVAFTNPAAGLTLQADSGGYVQVAYAIHVTTTSTAPISTQGIRFNPGETAASILSTQDNGLGDFAILVRYPAGSLGSRTVTPTVVVADVTGVTSDQVNGPAMTIKTVSTANRAPVVTITNPSTPVSAGFTSKAVNLDFTVSDPDGDVLTYTVDWGDGTPVTQATVGGDTVTGITVNTTHVFPDAFTSTNRSTTVRLNATDSRSSNASAVQQVRTFNIQFNTYPTATITTPQASVVRPLNSEITGSLPTGYVNPPGANDPDIVVIANGSKLNFKGVATVPGSGDPGLTYAWTFPGGSPATANTATPGDVTFSLPAGTITPVLVELKVTDAFSRSAANGPLANPKTFRKWVVVDGVNTQNFQMSYMYRLRSDNNGVVSLSPVKTAANGLGGTIHVFQDGVSNTFAIQNQASQATAVIPVRSNLPFYAKLGSVGSDNRDYLFRIPNAPTGPYADPGLGIVIDPKASSFGFLNGSAPFNPALQIVTAEGFAPETNLASQKRIQGVARPLDFPTYATPFLDPLAMTIGLAPPNTRYVERLSVPFTDPNAIQWSQTSNIIPGFENVRANQLFGEWVALLLNMSPNDALTAEAPRDTNSNAAGSSTDFGFNLDYSSQTSDSALSKTFAQNRLEAFRVPPNVTDPYDLTIAGWLSSGTTINLKPTQLSATNAQFFDGMLNGVVGSAALSGGINGFNVPYNANDPNRRPYAPHTASLIGIRQAFAYAEYLWSPVWAHPLVLNTAKLAYTQPISTYKYFRRSSPGAWPSMNNVTPDNSSFNMNVSGAGSFDPSTSPVGQGGAAAPGTGVGRFYWTAYTPYYDISSGALITRTWLSSPSGDPPTTFSGTTGDATAALGLLTPQNIVVDKRGRNADGSLNGQNLGGYRVTWFNPTNDSASNPVAPDFWVIETNVAGKVSHFLLAGGFPAGNQKVTDLILTDAATYLPSGRTGAAGPAPDGSDTVAPGYCWFDIPVELRPDVTSPGTSAVIRVFAAKSILKNQPPTGARKLTAADWLDAIKTVSANIKVTTNAGDTSYGHKIPFNYYWDIVVVNGPQTFVAP